jgi:hypothetical protein
MEKIKQMVKMKKINYKKEYEKIKKYLTISIAIIFILFFCLIITENNLKNIEQKNNDLEQRLEFSYIFIEWYIDWNDKYYECCKEGES